MITRRKSFGMLAGLACLAATRKATAQDQPAEKKVASYRLQEVGNLGVLSIEVQVNKSKLRMIVDTGAGRTFLTPSAAKKVSAQFTASQTPAVYGVDGSGVTDGKEAKVQIENIPVSVVVMSLPFSDKFDGQIGLDYWSKFDRMQMDFRRMELSLFLFN